MSRPLAVLVTITAAVVAACAAHDGAAPLEPTSPRLGKTTAVTDPTATFLFPLDNTSLGLQGDGAFPSGGASAYANGVCGVASKIFATTAYSNSGDATMQTDNPSSRDRTCPTAPRSLTVQYGDGVQGTATFINVNKIQNANLYLIPVGDTQQRGMNMSDSRCGGLRFKPVLADGVTTTGADNVLVHRTNDSTWVVQSQPAPSDQASCASTGALYHIRVSFTIVASRKLPLSF